MSPLTDPLPSDAADAALERLRPLVDWLVTYDQVHRLEMAEVTARAEQAEPRALQAEQRANDAQLLAQEAHQRADEAQRHAEEAQRRAEDAQHKLEDAQHKVEEARQEADRRVEAAAGAAAEVARRDADEWQHEAARLRTALADFEAGSRSRELQLLEAMRTYLVDVGGAQEKLLQLAREAIGPDGRSDGPRGRDAAAAPEASDGEATPPPQAGGDEDPRPDAAGPPTSPPEHSETTPLMPSVIAGQGHLAAVPPQFGDRTTDEHRILDLHNMVDMRRLEGSTARRGWLGRRMDRRRDRPHPTAARLHGA